MSKFSRRSFIATTGAIPFSLWFERYGAAQGPVTRYNAVSVEGQAMLKMYATAVGKMMNGSLTPESSPESWLFQWYSPMQCAQTGQRPPKSNVFIPGPVRIRIWRKRCGTPASRTPPQPTPRKCSSFRGTACTSTSSSGSSAVLRISRSLCLIGTTPNRIPRFTAYCRLNFA